MFWFLFWVLRYLLLALLYLLEISEVSPVVSFLKNINIPGSGISSSLVFVLRRIASQLKVGELKQWLGHYP